MSADETQKIIAQASDCADGECSLDEVGDLISILKAQQKELSRRVDEVDKMIAGLETVNAQDGRKVDEVRETVRALFRVFQLGAKASGKLVQLDPPFSLYSLLSVLPSLCTPFSLYSLLSVLPSLCTPFSLYSLLSVRCAIVSLLSLQISQLLPLSVSIYLCLNVNFTSNNL
jgi:hypothetical protein